MAPEIWFSEPDHLEDGPAFSRMSKESQLYVAAHWFWSMRHSSIWGRGLVPHHNFLKMLHAEEALSG